MAEILSKLSEDLADIVEASGSSVARVEGRRRLPASGVVWSDDGIIVTAHHVIERDDNIRISVGGETVKATLIGRDPTTDVAVLRAETSDLPTTAWAGPDSARVGHLVLALGRPGVTTTATLGVVSALDGKWRTPAGGRLEQYLMTDLVMYPGFSGGPLVNSAGETLGINTSALLRGVSLTVTKPSLDGIVESLLAHGHIRRGYLGIGTQPVRIPERITETVGQETGLLIVSVESDSPAEKAGMLLGDTIVGLNENQIKNVDDLLSLLNGDLIGQSVPARIVRGEQISELAVSIGERS
ncbi:MAG: trypsin-like peptidase domain-containing protein [SAR202 cluster bacterium]|jgi:S1-C subfamily serine protease|nr:trypsin-like peptidase domain-containing protein [SAR202 cluster bacterium]MDP6713581.1 trypsin-like peptidase domain-containing protein [SAR202 cluster bacterium]